MIITSRSRLVTNAMYLVHVLEHALNQLNNLLGRLADFAEGYPKDSWMVAAAERICPCLFPPGRIRRWAICTPPKSFREN